MKFETAGSRSLSAGKAVPEAERAPAAAWWWAPAWAASGNREVMPDEFSRAFGLDAGAKFADAAAILMTAIAAQDRLASPTGFPYKPKRFVEDDEPPQTSLAAE
ncbi:hypothetical protein [Rhodopseudomonas sp. B29]|uniref:hypothetical protein n=1 Tax=Rhodopseudomonas sp. B29 TaxID=95607 RepID=UPI0011D2ADB6|nr:hypothetical protein [Rhodopseudomonas sp. B29]